MIPALPVPTFAAAIANGMLFSAMPTLFTLYVVTNTTAGDYGRRSLRPPSRSASPR